MTGATATMTTTMNLEPPQAPPVNRRLVSKPHETVDTDNGTVEQLIKVRMWLLHGANHNDPAPWQGDSFRNRAGQR